MPSDAESVDTRWGPLTVTVCGERGRTPCLTLHDVGLNHRSCFQSLLLAAGPKSLLSKNFCFYHVDAPGCQAAEAETPASFLPLTLGKLVQALADVVRHFKLREVLGMGVGVGAYLLTQLAAENPSLFCGLILVSPCCQRPGWWEWAWGQVACRQLSYQGWGPSVKKYFVQRLFGELMQQALGGESDLLQAFRRECEQLPPLAVCHYLRAALTRPSISHLVPSIRCRLLLLFGGEALHKEDCVELATRASKDRFALLEAGVFANEERPQELVGMIESFLVALQLEGYGLGPGLVVGE
ncbi:hypothetical protein CHLNCDRAFT_140515 [Chlorella variabilis]|uniref:AB hydrolase-1 domain-containing protein n=1 Tax=Chlorella variabilis TaxID=554065 RepID=E1Z5K1_CHLVA|nr:hypothetical protein CHLNCDRAFT_140515 [Chlorella variabilis]EFN58770.1 hypothetical protein CHLNCDRAFT_140515 [Chlorella variabilis]|eukprot:XP_005850872.1 hypothetical protein CHLNCDRAFT_140515 [Chlorella variabilis]